MGEKTEKRTIIIWAIISIVIAGVIHFSFSLTTENRWFVAKWGAGDILTYFSTVSLGLLAMWQNLKFQKENENMQQRLERLTEDANNISIISKIIEYESQNLKNLKDAFGEFSQSADPQNIINLYGKGIKDNASRWTKIAMTDADNRLTNAYTMICRELDIDCSLNEKDEFNLKAALKECYNASLAYINILQKDTRSSDYKEMKKSVDCMRTFCTAREKYIQKQEAKMNLLLYGDSSLEEIKQMYKRLPNQSTKEKDS